MHFRIQTKETPALEVLKRGLKDLEKVCDHTIDLFEKEVKEFCKSYNLFHYFRDHHVFIPLLSVLRSGIKTVAHLQKWFLQLVHQRPYLY